MSFLDKVILNLDGNEISLEQGGRVKVLTDFSIVKMKSTVIWSANQQMQKHFKDQDNERSNMNNKKSNRF